MKLIPYKQHTHVGYCVYFLYDNDEIVYIGYTFNLGKRLGEHSQWTNTREGHRNQLVKKQFTHYSIIPMDDGKKARELESKLIKMIVDDFKNQKNNFGEKDFLSKLTKKELEKYVEDQILADGFLVADEE